MREPSSRSPIFGVLAEYDRPERLLECAKQTYDAGFRHLDAYSPFPIERLAETLGFRENRIPWLTLAGGLFGAIVAVGMQVGTNLAYPINIGGRPLLAPQAFALIIFELTVLFAVVFSVGGMVLLNRLPKLHHPLFDVKDFDFASSDRFFLVVFSNDALFDIETTSSFLAGTQPMRIEIVSQGERPE